MERRKSEKLPASRKITPVPYNSSLSILLDVFLFLERNTIELNQIVCKYWNDIIIQNNLILPIYLIDSLFENEKSNNLSLSYNPSLPILLEVFLFQERNTIESIQMVCRYWNDIIIRNHSILPIYLFERLDFSFYTKNEINMTFYSRFLKKSSYNLIDPTENHIDFSRIKSLKYGLFKYCDLRDGSEEMLKALKQLYDIIGEKIKVHKISVEKIDFNGLDFLKDCNAYIKVNEIVTSIDPEYLKLFLEHPIMNTIRVKKIKISISYPIRFFYNDPERPNDAYDSTLIKENTKKFIALIQNNEIYGINRFSFQFDDSHDIINEVPDFCENLMEIYMNTKDPTTLPRSIELRRNRDFYQRFCPTRVSENIPFLKLINEQNFKKQYEYHDGEGYEKDYTRFFKKIYEIKTKNEFVLRLVVEYGNRRYDAVYGDNDFHDEKNLFKSAKMKLLLTE